MRFINQFLFALSFLTRLPVGKNRFFGTIALADAAWAFPIVGIIVGLCSGLFFLACLSLNFSPVISAWLAVFFQILLTGGLHEDGLADSSDGLASGRDVSRKLEIMHDSRIGSYGVAALIISLTLRAEAISTLAGNKHILTAFMAADAFSRALMVLLMRSTKSAKNNGLAASAGRPSSTQTIYAISIGLFLLFLAAGFFPFFAYAAVLFIAFFSIRELAKANFGGITGDVLGAIQQISAVLLLVLLSRG